MGFCVNNAFLLLLHFASMRLFVFIATDIFANLRDGLTLEAISHCSFSAN